MEEIAYQEAAKEGTIKAWKEYKEKYPTNNKSHLIEATKQIKRLEKEEEEDDSSKTCVQKYKKKAEKGDADAQNKLGTCYFNGDGTPKDYYEAVKWYKKAADQGYDKADPHLD